uniref:RNA-directed DNA polymerase n=1 Tax=Tanacetum cinerariifolium TaxID=118510 RepID=A0A6L2MB72_TANCI|nr:retrovirus-related Pol polyprotein from transposon 17.6 [Tanacetum cinerariifolium]
MSVRLANRSFQYPIRIAENMQVEVGKFTFPVDFVILEMKEDSKVPLILGRPFLHTAGVVIRVKQKQLNLGVGTKRMTFSIDSAMKHSYSNDDTCFSIDVIDEILEEDFDALLDEGSKILYSIEGNPLEYKIFAKFNEFIAMNIEEILCMLAIFHDMIEESVEVFMNDFSVFGNSFDNCLHNLDKMLQCCKDANLVLNWEKCHFMVKEGIVLRHKVFGVGLEVDKAKIDNLPFELICDASEYAVRAVLGQKDGKHFHPVYFASKTLNAAQQDYTVAKKELMAIVFAFDKFRPYLVLSKTVVYTDYSALRHLFKKHDAKPRLIRWILLLKEFDIKIKDKKGTENVAADHLSWIENDETIDDDDEIDDKFPGETLMEISTRDVPWFADFANYLVGPETHTILDQCHHGPTGRQSSKKLIL